MSAVASEQSIMRLTYREKVPVSTMKEIIAACLQERLTGAAYEGEKCNESAKILSDTIRSRLKNLGFQRYKFVVQVVIGERREQGIRMGTRCFWDSGSDNSASETFMNYTCTRPVPGMWRCEVLSGEGLNAQPLQYLPVLKGQGKEALRQALALHTSGSYILDWYSSQSTSP